MKDSFIRAASSSFAAIALAALSNTIVVAQQTYTLTVVDPGIATESSGQGISNSGRTIVNSSFGLGQPLVNDIGSVQGSQGRISILSPLVGYTGSFAHHVNNGGDVAGASIFSQTDVTATLWKKNGQVVDIGKLPGWPVSWVRGFNNSGTVVGSAELDLFDGRGDRIAFRWKNGVMTPITHPAYQFGIGLQVNDRGTAVGALWNDLAVDAVGFLADKHGNVTIVPQFVGGDFLALEGINESGTCCGNATSGDAYAQGIFQFSFLRESDGTMTTIYPPAGYQVMGLSDINASATAIGFVYNVVTEAFEMVVYHDGAFTELTSALEPSPSRSWQVIDAHDINDQGDIIGTAIDLLSSEPTPVAVVLSPSN